MTGGIIDQAIGRAADQLPADPETPRNRGWRRAIGLAQICISDTPPSLQVGVHVDTRHAAESNGTAGVVLEAGPRVGRQALEAVLCESVVEVTAQGEDGIPMVYGPKTRTILPALRRAILHRDHHTCRGDGCDSHQPTSNPSSHPLEPGRENRSGQSDHPLLVPPSDHHPPARIHPPTPPGPPTHPIQKRRIQQKTFSAPSHTNGPDPP